MFQISTERIPCPLTDQGTETIDITVRRLIPDGCPADPVVLFSLGNESAVTDGQLVRLWKAFGS